MPRQPLKTSDLTFIGEGVQQPECVLALASGDVYASDHRGGIAKIREGAELEIIGAGASANDLRPNGFSILPGREFVVASLGEQGGVWKISAKGEISPFLMEVDGRKLPGVNFAGADAADRIWITISSWCVPRSTAVHKDAKPDGTIVLVDKGKARIAAEGLAYTNEARVHPSGEWLYVNETVGRRLSRFRIGANAELGTKETVTEFTNAAFPDGMAFDAEGHCWVACIVSQQVIRVDTKTGSQEIILDESTSESTAAEENFNRGEAKFWEGSNGQPLGSVSGLCFGGPDLRTVYLGSLTRNAIATFRSPVPGAKPHYWDY